LLDPVTQRNLLVLLLVALGVLYIATAIGPEKRLLRVAYWWRIPSKSRPSTAERVLFVLLGLTLIVVAAGILLFDLGDS
jgi:hypothetical protein